jgi:hypothetical protein
MTGTKETIVPAAAGKKEKIQTVSDDKIKTESAMTGTKETPRPAAAGKKDKTASVDAKATTPAGSKADSGKSTQNKNTANAVDAKGFFASMEKIEFSFI